MKKIIYCLPLLLSFWSLEASSKTCNVSQSTCIPTHMWSQDACACVPRPTSNASSEGNSNGPGPSVVDQMVQRCQVSLLEAQNYCDENKDAGVQDARTTLSNFAVGMGSQMGIQGACSALGKVLTGANAAVSAYSQLCISAKTKCTTSCVNAKAAVIQSGTEALYQLRVEESLVSCKALSAQVDRAAQAMNNMVNTIGGAQSCAKQAGTDLFDFCKSNPSAIGCANAATDCSNPSIAASNPICICKANPNAANCTGSSLKATNGFADGEYSATSLAAAGATAGESLDSSGSLNDVSWSGDPNLKADPSRAEDVGGSKGGRPLGEGGGGSGGGAGEGGGGAGAGTAIAVNAGFRGGGGGGLGSSWSSGGGYDEGTNAGVPPAQGPNGGPDLRQFLPGGKFDPKTRGLAGLSGPDGITGPHTDIWKKIQNRYQVEQRKLMP